MGHHITALLINQPFRAPDAFDLTPITLTPTLTLFHIDHYYSAYWQSIRGGSALLDLPDDLPSIFPSEGVLVDIVRELTGHDAPTWGLIQTDYFGGMGDQWAALFTGAQRITSSGARINAVLRGLGIVRSADLDEFDTVGLGNHRHSPESLDRYVALCDERGV